MTIKSWWIEYKRKRERCVFCGWYLHPQLIFKGIDRPSRHTYGRIDGKFVCNHCYELEKKYQNEQRM